MKVAFDFDGVLAYHEHDMQENQVGDPLPVGIALLKACVAAGHDCFVLTARSKFHKAMVQWIKKHTDLDIRVTNIKESADWYFDDKSNFPRNLR